MPYWFASTLAALPAVLWMVFGLGVPWALAALPRADWRDRPLVAACALAFGPALLTAWMFVLGVTGGASESALIVLPNILAGTAVLSALGLLIVWIKRRPLEPPSPNRPRLLLDARIILTMLGASLALVWLTTAYWPFIHYDTLWVYGYQGKLYALNGYIPQSIGYYPPFMALQYTYAQLAAGLGIDDHAARAVIFPLYLGSIMMTYALGARLFNRRTGLFAAALWGLYPHVAQWGSVGDLEIPQTFMFTGAATFFLMGWTALNRRDRLVYGALGGVFLGIAMWTKPTAGAFILGVVLLVALDLLRVRFDWRRWLPRFEMAFAAGVACIPLGAAWYVRNLLLGHDPITLPNEFWLTQAMRSGQEFGWGVLALALVTLWVLFGPLKTRPDWRLLLAGGVIIAAALLPTTLAPRRMTLPEFAGVALGAGLVAVSLTRYYWHYATPAGKRTVARLGWALALATPYLINWFWNYSYHYRLQFAIVPLLILPSAVLLAVWLTPEFIAGLSARRRALYHGALLAACVPGVIIPLHNHIGGWDWLWTDRFPNDFARLESFNYALAHTVMNLEKDIAAQGIAAPVIVAPGLERLPFFFPQDDVRIRAAPTTLEELRGVDYYIYTQEARWYYEELGLPGVNQVTGSMPRGLVMSLVTNHEDSSFYAYIFRVRDLDRRFQPPNRMIALDDTVQIGDFARLAGYNLNATTLTPDAPLQLELHWQALRPADLDYTVYVHLRDADGQVAAAWDDLPLRTPYAHYSTRDWEAGEYIEDPRTLPLPPETPPGEYALVIGFYDLTTLARVPLTVNGAPTDGYTFAMPIRVTR